MKHVAYSYEASIHCIDCTRKRFSAQALDDDALEDREGNSLYAIHDIEVEDDLFCDTCRVTFYEP